MNPGQNDGGRGAAADADPLPQCKRILLFKFTKLVSDAVCPRPDER